MNEPKNPHDSLFKATLTDKVIASDLLRNLLPKPLSEKIDYDSLTMVPGSYITPELQKFYSDILYECNFGEKKITVALLFEHKSTPPDFPHFQLLRYMVEGWPKAEENKKNPKPFIPIILYHGKRKWRKQSFESYFEGIDPELLPFLPSFDYILIDLDKLSDEDIMAMEAGLLINTLLLFKHHGENDYIRHSIHKLFSGTESYVYDDATRNKIVSFSVYLWTTSKIKENEFSNLLNQLPEPIKNTTMTTYQQMAKRVTTENQNKVITNAVKEGFDLKVIATLTELTLEEVKKRIIELGLQ